MTLRDIAFAPKSLSVARGTTVTFAWRDDDTAHNVVSKGAKRFTPIATREHGLAVAHVHEGRHVPLRLHAASRHVRPHHRPLIITTPGDLPCPI